MRREPGGRRKFRGSGRRRRAALPRPGLSARQPAPAAPPSEPPTPDPRVVQDLLKDHCDPVVEPGHKLRGINTL